LHTSTTSAVALPDRIHISQERNVATSTASGTVVGVFENPTQAQKAVNDLRKAGYRDDQIGVVSHNRDGSANVSNDASGNKAAEGAAAGVATGAGVGALWGLGILSGVLPGIGPAIAGGTLGILLSSAAAGAAAAGVAGALVGLGIPDEDAAYYEGEFKSGRTIVTVKDGAKGKGAHSVLTQHGGYNRQSSASV
jgi:hypothetical protein